LLRVLAVWCCAVIPLSAETLTVLNSQAGTTPLKLGYNLGHFMQDSNAADWFRYSGADAARVFISVADIEPSDDLAPAGDGVDSQASFLNRRALLRGNAASGSATLSDTYVKWSVFSANYADLSTGNNRMRLDHALGTLRGLGVEALANISASPSRFPIAGDNDWPGKWELWQHYYAQAFLLSRDYGVRRFSMFNEPNGVVGMTEADWLRRLIVCSDAVQCAVADMNSRYGKNLLVEVFAPNTANGAEKYNAADDTWGRDAVASRHLRIDGTSPLSWMNLHAYNYQKYTHRQVAEDGFSGFINDHDTLRGSIDADMAGEPRLPLALTEFNVRTGASYDTTTATQDSPFDYAALGANCIALAGRGVGQLYLFKFGQTASDSFYGIAKNGTHYVQNAPGTDRNYGGATQCAEVYRLFIKAASGARPRLEVNATAGAAPGVNAGLWSMATHDPATGTYHVFLSNREAGSIPLEVDFSALPVPADNPVFVEEVSGRSGGGVVRMESLANGRLAKSDMPGQSVWLITLPGRAMALSTKSAVADTQLGDGSSKHLPGGGIQAMEVRADGTIDGRRACLIRIPVPAGNSPNIHSVLLEVEASTTSGTSPVRAHVYGVTDNSWTEAGATWAGAAGFLKQNVPAGNLIENNIVAGQGERALILGQLVVDSPVSSRCSLDVTKFVRSRGDGFASFLIVQDHRWDVAQPGLTQGDTQSAGLIITSREGTGTAARLVAITSDLPPVIETQPRPATVDPGATVTMSVNASGAAPLRYQWRKNGIELPGADSSSYVIASATPADSGDYQVVVDNMVASQASEIARLAVNGSGVSTVAREAVIRGGSFAGVDVDEAATGYLMVKFNNSLDTARKAYFQFDLPPDEWDPEAPATFRLAFQNSFAQRVQLWGMNQAVPDFSSAMTWNSAPANDIATNGILTIGAASATAIGADVRISPGSALAPHSFIIPRLGDFAHGGRVTLILSGVESDTNNSGGLRISPASATLHYSTPDAPPDPDWDAWRESFFGGQLENESVSGAAADPDHDRAGNLLEYALGGDPLTSDPGFLPTLERPGGRAEFRFSRNPALTDLRMVVQFASDLEGGWNDAAVSIGGAPFASSTGSVEVSEVEDGALREVLVMLSDDPLVLRRFLRLRVELIQ
jgi:hypothetical protein